MERPEAYRARALTLSAMRYVWTHRDCAWAFLLLPLPAMLLSLPDWLSNPDPTAIAPFALATVPLTLVLQNMPWAVGGGLGEAIATLPHGLGPAVRALQPRLGRLVWLGMRYLFNLCVAGLKGLVASAAVALIYFVVSAATGFVDHRGTADLLNLAMQTLTAIACTLIMGYFLVRVVADMFMAPVWVARGLEVDAAIARSREFAVGRTWHIVSVLGWLTLLPCIAALGVCLSTMHQLHTNGTDMVRLGAQMKLGSMWVGLANWVMAPIAGMAPAMMQRQELSWAMPQSTQVAQPPT